ncbi:MAG TPA: serine hydrolase domain-containing protein, partial [Thermoanaerobaculia bacterium]|nr:serine hydrolase domain-containing protein [Thermoanaerobaculia bacterium]
MSLTRQTDPSLRRIVLVTLAAIALSASVPGIATQTTPGGERGALAAELDAAFAAAYPADGPGAAVLVEKGGEVILRRGYGMAHLELGVPIAPDMVFRLGSITKQFTAAAILLLVE